MEIFCYSPRTFFSDCVSVITLSFFFSFTLYYVIIVPAVMYVIITHQSIWVFLALVVICSTPWWARKEWYAFGEFALFSYWRSFFELRVIKDVTSYPNDKRLLLVSYPHGLFPIGLPLLHGIAKDIFPELTEPYPHTAVADVLFKTPILSPIMTWLGCVSAKTPLLQNHRRNVIILPDGIAGIYHSERDQERLFVHKRVGFIKTALHEGASLVPMYCFGHTQLFDIYPNHSNHWLARLSRWLRFSIVFYQGPFWWFGAFPYRSPITIVIGKPIHVKKCANPSQEDITSLQRVFIEQLTSLFNKHKSNIKGWTNKELILE